MSKCQFDSDGFQIVKSKRISKNKQSKISPEEKILNAEHDVINIEKVIPRIQLAIEEIESSKYFKDAHKSVSSFLRDRTVVDIVCFGLGHVGECNISRYQLSFLLCLNKFFKPEKVSLHDPIFSKSDCGILKHFGLNIIEKNNEGSYIISDQNITLAYFPHCPKQLTNNFLWSNWSTKLQNCILICNSFTSLIENHPKRFIFDNVPYIYKIFPYTCELPLENDFKFTDIFNDISVHSFFKDNLDKIDPIFWTKGNKPKYNNDEEFITSLMIEKLKI